MPKSSTQQIEIDEKKILEELSKNADKSVNDIANKLGFSRQKVWRIIKNLEKNHIIWGYIAVIDNQKINKKRYVMLIKRSQKPVPKDFLNQIITREMSDKAKKIGVNFINSVLLNGTYDWLISFTAENLIQAKNLVELYYQTYKDLISEIELNEYLFPVLYDGIQNPEIKKLGTFF